jgi:hypothetical protein
MRGPVRLCIFAFLLLTPLLSQSSETEFKGRIDGLPAGAGVGSWQIAGKTVAVTTSTKLDSREGAFVVGACVQVKGSARPDGSVAATEIKTEDSSECAVAAKTAVAMTVATITATTTMATAVAVAAVAGTTTA